MDLKQLPRNVLYVEYRLLRLPLTLFEVATGRGEGAAVQGTGQEASRGLVEDVVGRVKQFAGIVLGDNHLAAEGQLQQAKGEELREAAAKDVVASRQRQAAAKEYAADQRQLTAERTKVEREKAQQENELEQRRRAEKARVDEQAKARKAAARQAAKAEQAAVDRQAAQVARKRASRTATAGAQKSAAAQARAEAQRLEKLRKSS
jgi:uncharacterized protein YjbJ (UPF0337 family)